MSILAALSDGDVFEKQRILHKLRTLDAESINNLCLSTKLAGDTFDASLLLAAFQVLAQVWCQIPRLYRFDIVHLLADRLKVAGEEELRAALQLQGRIVRKEVDIAIRQVVAVSFERTKSVSSSEYTPAERHALYSLCRKNPDAVTWDFPTNHPAMWHCAVILNRPVEIPTDPYMRCQVGAYGCAEARFDLASDAWRGLWQNAHSRRVYCYLHALETMADALKGADIALLEDAAHWAREGDFVLLEAFLDALFELWALRLASCLAKHSPGTLAESSRLKVPGQLQRVRDRFHAMSTSASLAWRRWATCRLEDDIWPVPIGVMTLPDGCRLKLHVTARSVDGGTLLSLGITSVDDARWTETEVTVSQPCGVSETHIVARGVDHVLVAFTGVMSVRATMMQNRVTFGFPRTIKLKTE